MKCLLLGLLIGLGSGLCDGDRSGMSPALSCSQQESDGRLHLLFFFGTRPEIVKLAPVILQFNGIESVRVSCIFTGQQPNLMKSFLDYWNVKPDVYIPDTMQHGQSLAMLHSRLLSGIDSAVESCGDSAGRQLWVVQGDTTTAYAAGSVAYYRGTPLAHVEAGLRTWDMQSPFPEEFNRRSLALISAFQFAPTQYNRLNLLAQGVDPQRIFVTGNTGIDAVRLAQINLSPPMLTIVGESLFSINSSLNFTNLVAQQKKIVLFTMHRRENKKIMAAIFETIESISCLTCVFIVPVHPNPVAREVAVTACTGSSKILCVEPMSYDATQYVIAHSRFLMTDSGGLQEEATYYSKPVVVLRDSTDRPEAVVSGQAVLLGGSGVDLSELKKVVKNLLSKPGSDMYKRMSINVTPFGEGYASELIAQAILDPQNSQLFHKSLVMKNLHVNGIIESRPSTAYCTFDGEHRFRNCVFKDSITVVLTMYRHDSLALSLKAAAEQTLRPQAVIVIQRSNSFGNSSLPEIIDYFRTTNSDIDVEFVRASEESGSALHNTFKFAYTLARTEYVSMWDDDVYPNPDWLRSCVDQSKGYGDALIGGSASTVRFLMPRHAQSVPFSASMRSTFSGVGDFVGLSWTLRREHLKHFFDMAPLFYFAGEDVQLSFALQLNGISSRVLDINATSGRIYKISPFFEKSASLIYPSVSYMWQYALCEMIEAGFKMLDCINCDPASVRRCMTYFQEKIMHARKPEGFDEEMLRTTLQVEIYDFD